jgi:hypothetical protein
MCCLSSRLVAGTESLPETLRMGEKTRADPSSEQWLFSAGRVAFYSRNAGSVKTERWLFSSGLRNPDVVDCFTRMNEKFREIALQHAESAEENEAVSKPVRE